MVNDWMGKKKKLEKDEILFKNSKEEKTHIKAVYKACTNFVLINSNNKPKCEH